MPGSQCEGDNPLLTAGSRPRGAQQPSCPQHCSLPRFSFPKAKHVGCLSCSRAAQQLLRVRPGEGAGSRSPHQQYQGWAVPEPQVRRSSLLQAAARSSL